MGYLRNVLRYGAVSAGVLGTVGAAVSLKSNQYNLDSIGIVRFGRASFAAVNIVFYYKRSLYGYGKNWDKNSKEYLELRSKVHKKAASRLLELCQANKGVYIKVGQHIGALDYVLPVEYVETMKVLHSQAPASTIEDVYKVLREDLLKDPDDIFESIDPTPLGAASLAQVHKATLKDGRVLALKVQHAAVKGNSLVDMKTMEILAKVVSWVLPDFKMQWLVNATKENIPKELNFQVEADNTEEARRIYGHLPWLKIPAVYRELCSRRVLALEFVEGGQINDIRYIKEHKINCHEISDKLGRLYGEMIFKRGFVHSDPHPGNILIRKNEKGSAEIILLDHGLYATLTDDFRYKYANFWISILNSDMDGIAIHASELGVPDLFWLFAAMATGRSWDAIKAGLSKTKYDNSEKDLFQKEVPDLLSYISSVLTDVNKQMILIFKTNDLLRGIEHTLHSHPRMESFSTITRNCIETIYTEKKRQSTSKLSKLKISCQEYWMLFKLSMYFTYLRMFSWFAA